MQTIVLVGFMGSGKTTVGQCCAKRLGVTFVDTDREIERQTQQSIPEIFSVYGEERFRQLEEEVLAQLLQGSKQVLATGGGVVLRPTNRSLLKKSAQHGSRVIWLKTDPDVVLQRVRHSDRPLLQGCNPLLRIRQLLNERDRLYKEVATETVDTSHISLEQVVEEISHSDHGCDRRI